MSQSVGDLSSSLFGTVLKSGVEAFKLSEEDESAHSSEALQRIYDTNEGVTFRARTSSCQSHEEHTLLHWILAQGNKASLQDILDYCQKGLKLIDAEPLKEREAELYNILEYANNHGLKQIKGIEDRLYGLDQLLNDYRERISSACDPSVLPTLVQSHWCQLQKLLKGHQSLFDIRRRIAKAVLKIENSMSVQDAHAMLSFQCFNRLARYFGIVSQLHAAPAVRQDFNSLFDGHFLRSLFPGMTELPPAFATQTPSTFDGKLPQLTDEDVEYIATAFPLLAEAVPNFDMESTVKINASHHEERDANIQVDFDNDTKQKVDTSTICVPDTMAVSTVTEVRTLPVIMEVDSPVFENSDLYIEESLPSSLEWGRSERQDNMETHKINIEKFQQFILKLFDLCKAHIVYLMEELVRMKNEISEQKDYVNSQCVAILDVWTRNNEETAIQFREQTQRLTVDHELELSDMKAALNEKDDIISSLKIETANIKLEHQKEIKRFTEEQQSTKDILVKTREEIGSFENKLEEVEVNKQKEIRNLQEKMHQDYKTEIESLRSRFRLVALTNMDRSPSESSLEKIERTDMIEIASHNAIVMQTKENAEVDKEDAVKVAVEKCEVEWRAKFDAEIVSLKAKFEAEKQVTLNDVTRRLLSEKDRQLELLREREQVLVKECGKYRDTIQQLTDPETNDYDSLLKTQMATLENQKASSPKRDEGVKKSRSRCHTPCGLSAGTLSLSSCLPGHTVLVMWDPAHLNYTLMQEASIMYFVHSDCLPALELSIEAKSETERRLYAIATVESKEYCYAKKSGNRYNMPRGSRFYRVRVRPARSHAPHPPCCDHRHKHDIQKSSVDTSQSTSSATDEASRVAEVATATLINLESPVSTSEAVSGSSAHAQEERGEGEDQLDSIEASEQWQSSRMQ
ncbi:putative rb1-inducible coiled-coil 1, partial [Operophtera brumata]